MKLCELDYLMQSLYQREGPRSVLWQDTVYRSAEYQKAIEPFLRMTAELEKEIAAFPVARREEAFQEAQKTIVRTEYGKGGEFLPLGFYGPDPVEDLMVTGIHRGRILKRITDRTKPRWLYGFDANGKLRTLVLLPDEEIGIVTRTVLVYQTERVWCLKFNEHEGRLTNNETICLKADGKRLLQMIRVSMIGERVAHADIYDYSYGPQGIEERVCTQIFVESDQQLPFLPAMPSCVLRTAVRFAHDEEGRVSGYYTSWSDGWMAEAAVPTEIPIKNRRIV